jgi:hypothetical protein
MSAIVPNGGKSEVIADENELSAASAMRDGKRTINLVGLRLADE